jgi:Family of unknown function (DUF6502)
VRITHNMKLIPTDILPRVIGLLIRPVAKFCLLHAVKIQELIEILKAELYQAACQDLVKKNQKITISRLSVLTGLRRREIERLEQNSSSQEKDGSRKNLIAKVVGLWQQDKRFLTKAGTPRVLKAEGLDNEFATLTAKVSKELAAGTVLFELERLGIAKKTLQGIKLVSGTFVPKGNLIKGFELISQHIENLIEAASYNVLHTPKNPNHHLITEYDRIYPGDLDLINSWLLNEGHNFHLKVRKKLGQHDQDINPNPKFEDDGRKVVFASFSYIERDCDVEEANK